MGDAGADAFDVAAAVQFEVDITVRMTHTPGRLQSRVNVVGRMLTFGVFQPLGALAAGVLAEHLSVGWTLALCGLPMVVAGLAGVVSLQRTGRAAGRPARSSSSTTARPTSS